MKKVYFTFLTSVFLILSTALSACGSTPVDYTTADKNTNEKTLTAQVSAKPDSVETDENGMKMVTYDKSEYGDYTGKMVYYFLEDKLMMSRWETSCDGAEEMQKTYQDLCKDIKKEMGDGTVNDAKDATMWSDDGKTITVSFYNGEEEDMYTVSILENELSGDTSVEATTEPTTEANTKPAKKPKK